MIRKSLVIVVALVAMVFAATAVYAAPASLKNNYPDEKVLKGKAKPAVKKATAVKSAPTKTPTSIKLKSMPVVEKKVAKPAATTLKQPVKLIAKKEPEAKVSKKLPPEKIKKPIIVIDAGHGGKDPGATGKAGTYEKRLTLDYALGLTKALERDNKYKVVLTRNRDIYLTLNERIQKAKKAKGDIFISLHADSISNPMTRGFSVYTLSGDRAARVANRLIQNAEKNDEVLGINMKGQNRDVKNTLIYMAQKDTRDTSATFSSIVARKLGQKVKPLEKTRREASLQVLTAAEMPSVLIELGYLSNTLEEKLLQTKEHKQKIVNGLKDAIDEYFHK